MELQLLESTFREHQFLTEHERITAIAAVVKRFKWILDYEKEVQWLTMATELIRDEFTLFHLHFLLTRLHWQKLNNQEKALQHGQIAYDFAMHLMDDSRYRGLDIVFKAAVRLADMLHQIDGRHMEAGQYFREALDRLPFIDADADFIITYEEFIVGHLMSIDYQSSQYVLLLKHYGQWVELDMSRTSRLVQMMLELPYHPPTSSGTGLAETDVSLDHLGIVGTARQFLNVRVQRTYEFTYFYSVKFLIVIALLLLLFIFLVVACCSYFTMICTIMTVVTLLSTFVWFTFFLLPIYCIHYFLFCIFLERKLWVPRKVPVIPKPILYIFSFVFLIVLFLLVLSSLLGVYFWSRHSDFVHSPIRNYHNKTMDISDNVFYHLY